MSLSATSSSKPGMIMGQGPFDSSHYLKAAFGGAVCCSLTHGATTPIDVVKTRMQLDPKRYTSFMGTFNSVRNAGGMAALTTGAMATFQGYFVQGFFKFGGVEVMKTKLAQSCSTEEDAYKNRDVITLGGSAAAEFVADIFLCPYEACRIRSVSDPTYADGMLNVGRKLVAENGVVAGLYSGFAPMLFKQIPYTMAKFAVQQKAAEKIYDGLGTDPSKCSSGKNISISLLSGVIAGVAAATISQPADGLLSKVNKKGAGGDGSMVSRLANIASETGIVKLCTEGLFARWLHVGLITAGQFAVVDMCMMAVGASRFHFHDPSKH
ncbi:hypothetical protein ACHAWF_007536 [Thalassiosira exigua]